MGSEFGVTADSKKEANLDGVGIWWVTWACVWTFVLLCGMGYLIYRRDTPILRIRGIGMSLAAVVLLHLYFFSVQLGYVVGALAPGDCEYWIMGTYLPLGIAMFHASNSRFLYVAKVQKKYLNRQVDGPAKSRRGMGILDRFRSLNYTTRMVILVSMGMGFQLFLTILMWLISRKWHSGWGIPGTEVYGTEMEQRMEMGRGWEWWPGIFWQFVWAWIVAPCVLWKSRNINDTHGWRLQTIGCAVAGLHATPMWLIALYVPAMEPVNKYFLPPQWICISILVLEILTVFLPCWEVVQASTLRQETLDSIAQWERKNKNTGSSAKSVNTASTAIDSLMSGRKSTVGSVKSTDSQESILTMSALEYVLERNPTPLQEFSSLRDFSGENIAFLTSVAEWKTSLPQPVRDGVKDSTTRELIRERFNSALRIYAEFISIKDAEFPINISSTELKRMEAVFEASARTLYGDKVDVDPATPFDFPEAAQKTSMETSSQASEKGRPAGTSYSDGVKFWGEIPESFDETVFDESEKHIKYLVLTNTWPKFVKDRRVSIDMGASAERGPSIMSFVRSRRQKR
ncbi:Regulator of G protein signaling superfamily [Metarhizium brunneum]